MKRLLIPCAALMIAATGLLAGPPGPGVFLDGFESGDALEWNGGPPVKWTPGNINKTVAVGDAATVQITLLVRKDLPATILEVTPSLQDFVSISPSSLPSLAAGTEVSVSLLITAVSIGEKGGTLRVRQATGPPRTFARPLQITVIGAEDTSLPPEPDPEENNATLEGVDTNGDGIRDDVEIFIASNTSSPEQRDALRQYALALSLTYSPAEYESAHSKLVRSLSCYFAVQQVDDSATGDELLNAASNAWDSYRDVRSNMLNTEERIDAYLAYNSSRSGKSTVLPPNTTDSCDFIIGGVQ